MLMMVWRLTPVRSASSSWVMFFSKRRRRMLLRRMMADMRRRREKVAPPSPLTSLLHVEDGGVQGCTYRICIVLVGWKRASVICAIQHPSFPYRSFALQAPSLLPLHVAMTSSPFHGIFSALSAG